MQKIKYLLFIVVGAALWIFGNRLYFGETVVNNKSLAFDVKPFETILETLHESYYNEDKIQTGDMEESALKAYVDAIDDPFTVYLDAVEHSWFDAVMEWESDFEGIGAVVKKKEYYVLIEEVLKDSPAQKAWIKPLDRIIAVDTGSVRDLDIYEAIKRIKGPKNTKVVLAIERVDRKDNSKKEIFKIEVTRDEMQIPSVRTKFLTGKNQQKYFYIDISLIWEKTEMLFKQDLAELDTNNIDWVILDLRGNWGWFLPIAVQVASHFLPKWDRIVSAEYRIRSDEIYDSLGYNNFNNIPVVVLINDYTASAGEIIALALQEQIGAKLIWTTTFGKWSIQTIEIFDNGAAMKYTIWMRYSPSGKNVDKSGVSPDTKIEFDVDLYIDKEIDNQLEAAKKALSDIIK